MMNAFHFLSTAVSLTTTTTTCAFAPPHLHRTRATQQLILLNEDSAASISSPFALNMMGEGIGWEDIVYRAESVASSLASVSLKDPSNLVTSIPIMYGAGLLTSVSPCVWGLLPLTVSYIRYEYVVQDAIPLR